MESGLIGQQGGRVDLFFFLGDQSGFDSGQVEQFGRHIDQGFDPGRRPGQDVLLFIGQVAGQAVQDDFELHQDGIHGASDFMGDHGYEIVLELVHLPGNGDVV